MKKDAAIAPNYDALLERVGDGESVNQVVKELGISRYNFYAALLSDPILANRYAAARELQADARFDTICEIADEVVRAARDKTATQEYVAAMRLAIDAEKWATAKLKPKVYGDRIDVAVEQATTLILLDYGRSERLKPAIDVAVIPERATPNTLITQEVKRVPKAQRVKGMSQKRRAKYEANRARLEAARAAYRSAEAKKKRAADASSRPQARRKKGGGPKNRAR